MAIEMTPEGMEAPDLLTRKLNHYKVMLGLAKSTLKFLRGNPHAEVTLREIEKMEQEMIN